MHALNCGLQRDCYALSMQAQIQHHEPLPVGRRVNSRARIYAPASFTLLDGAFACLLEDLSFTGARIAINHAPRPASSGILACGPLDVFCSVVWSLDQKCGLQFEEPVDLDMIRDTMNFAENYPAQERRAFERAAEEWVKGRAGLFGS